MRSRPAEAPISTILMSILVVMAHTLQLLCICHRPCLPVKCWLGSMLQ